MTKEKRFNIYFICISLFVFIIAVIRSFKMGITYDEAITYLNFVNHNEFARLDIIANNHLLNTFLIKLITYIPNTEFNEFIIRLPNLIFYIIYIIYTYRLSKLYKQKYSIATILLLNYSINEFASLARGYLMAAAIVLAGIYYYKKWLLEENKKDLIKALFVFLFSCIANTITLIIFGCFLIDAIIRLIQQKKLLDFVKNNKIVVTLLLIFSYLILIYHLFVCFNDKYLLYCKDNFFDCIIYTPIRYYGISFINPIILVLIILIFISFICINVKKIKFKKNNQFYMILFLFFIFIILKYIFPFKFPSGRTLIPFYSIYVISLFDFFNLLNNNKLIKITIFLITIISIISFAKNLNINYVREWKDDRKIKQLAETKYKNNKKIFLHKDIKEKQISSTIFYYSKYKKLYSYQLMDENEYVHMLLTTKTKK